MLVKYMREYPIKINHQCIKIYVALETVGNVAEKIAGHVLGENTNVVGPIFEIQQTFVKILIEWLHVA